MKQLPLLIIVIFYLLFTSSSHSADKFNHSTVRPINVVFFAPEPKGVEFWELMIDVMQASVKDLNIKLELERFIVTEYPLKILLKDLRKGYKA